MPVMELQHRNSDPRANPMHLEELKPNGAYHEFQRVVVKNLTLSQPYRRFLRRADRRRRGELRHALIPC
jgi:hypothetical protein